MLWEPRVAGLGQSLVIAVVVLLFAAVNAAAQRGSLRHLAPGPAGVDAVAYAGTERVYASGRALMRLSRDGRAARVSRLRGRGTQLEASATVVALVERRGKERRLLAGPPAGPLRTLAHCRGRHREIPLSPLAVAGSAVAEALSCERARGIYNGTASFRVHDGDAVRTVSAPAGERFIALAGAPGMLASAAQPEDLQGPVRVEVSDPSSGALRYAVPGLPEPLFAQTLAVQADGVSVFSGSPDRLAWASPGAPSMHPVGRVDCPAEAISVADGRIAYHDVRSDSLRVADLDGRADTLIRRAGGLPFDWNGARLLVRGLGCGEDFLGERSRRGAAYRGPPCHVRVLGAVRGRSRAVARVTVECKPGCRGDVELLLGHEGDYDRATVRLRHAGRRAVRIRLRAHARRLLRNYRRVPFHATMTYTNPADGANSQPLAERSGILRGDGRRNFPPRRPRPPD